MELKVKRLHPDAKLPRYGHKGDAGLDLYTNTDLVLKPGDIVPVPTGIVTAIPCGYVGLIWDKSGISLKAVHRLAGVVDSGYRGEIKVVMVNLGQTDFVVEKGMKIAQMLIQAVSEVEVVETETLEDTSRGSGGFGSTGKY
ncbi:MAG: dUTP diphosphatase [Candidatus Aminicenantes bacterium]|nr:dUTP diphosphatase [Candidatus Aminicenantes bacterium]